MIDLPPFSQKPDCTLPPPDLEGERLQRPNVLSHRHSLHHSKFHHPTRDFFFFFLPLPRWVVYRTHRPPWHTPTGNTGGKNVIIICAILLKLVTFLPLINANLTWAFSSSFEHRCFSVPMDKVENSFPSGPPSCPLTLQHSTSYDLSLEKQSAAAYAIPAANAPHTTFIQISTIHRAARTRTPPSPVHTPPSPPGHHLGAHARPRLTGHTTTQTHTPTITWPHTPIRQPLPGRTPTITWQHTPTIPQWLHTPNQAHTPSTSWPYTLTLA